MFALVVNFTIRVLRRTFQVLHMCESYTFFLQGSGLSLLSGKLRPTDVQGPGGSAKYRPAIIDRKEGCSNVYSRIIFYHKNRHRYWSSKENLSLLVIKTYSHGQNLSSCDFYINSATTI